MAIRLLPALILFVGLALTSGDNILWDLVGKGKNILKRSGIGATQDGPYHEGTFEEPRAKYVKGQYESGGGGVSGEEPYEDYRDDYGKYPAVETKRRPAVVEFGGLAAPGHYQQQHYYYGTDNSKTYNVLSALSFATLLGAFLIYVARSNGTFNGRTEDFAHLGQMGQLGLLREGVDGNQMPFLLKSVEEKIWKAPIDPKNVIFLGNEVKRGEKEVKGQEDVKIARKINK